MQFEALFHLPLSDMQYHQYSLGCYPKPTNFAWYLPSFHSHSMKISRIAKLKAGSQTTPKTAHSTYWSCHDTIRTQIHNWSQSCRSRKVGTAERFQPGQIPTVLCPVRVTTHQDMRSLGSWPGLELNQTGALFKTQTAGGLPRPIVNTNDKHIEDFITDLLTDKGTSTA